MHIIRLFEVSLLSIPALLCPLDLYSLYIPDSLVTRLAVTCCHQREVPDENWKVQGRWGGATGCSFSLFFQHIQKEDFPASLVLFSVRTGFFLCWVALAAVGSVIAAVAAVSQTPLQPAGDGVPSSVNSTSFLGVVAASWSYWPLGSFTFNFSSCRSFKTAIGSSPNWISKFENSLRLP